MTFSEWKRNNTLTYDHFAFKADMRTAQARLSQARESLLDAFQHSTDPAPLLRLIEDLAIVQERLSAIKE